jgi:hypothetical protein
VACVLTIPQRHRQTLFRNGVAAVQQPGEDQADVRKSPKSRGQPPLSRFRSHRRKARTARLSIKSFAF